MKHFIILFVCLCANIASAVTVDGFCYLEGQQSHAGTKVKFIKVSPSAVTDSTFTQANGFFAKNVVPGIYHVAYVHDPYRSDSLYSQLYIMDATLASHTLIRPLSGSISGSIGPGYYSVIGNVVVGPYSSVSIAAGTIIDFDSAFVFDVYGFLHAYGTVSDSVHFTCDLGLNLNRWRGIRLLSDSNQSHFDYCVFENALRTDSGGAVYIRNNPPTFTDCSFRNNTMSGVSYFTVGSAVYGRHCSPTFVRCMFAANTGPYSGAAAVYFVGGASAFFDSCTISNGSGGGVSMSGASVGSFAGSQFIDNTGAAVSFDGADFFMYDCVASHNGGGVTASSLSIDVQRLSCTSNQGTGLTIWGASGQVVDCDFSSNSGSGIRCGGVGLTAEFSRCRISGNRGTNSDGGGIWCYEGSPCFRDCHIDSNKTLSSYSGDGGKGGGLYCADGATPKFDQCTFLRDSANGFNNSGSGGGAYSKDSRPSLTNCTIANCYSNNAGHSIYTETTTYVNSPSFIANSCTLFGHGVDAIYFISGSTCQIAYCDFYGNDSPFRPRFGPSDMPPAIGLKLVTNANGDSADIYENIFEDPMFADTSNGDYSLLPGSPCIDAGDPELPRDPDSTIADIGASFFMQDLSVWPGALAFGSIPVLNSDTLTATLRNMTSESIMVFGFYSSDSAAFIAYGSDSGNVIAPHDSLQVHVVFTPTAPGGYAATLVIASDAPINNVLTVALSGEGGITPPAVDDVVLQVMGNDAHVCWSVVDSSEYGSPISVDAYLVYFSEQFVGPFYFLGLTTDTCYVHAYAAQFASAMHYQVSAFIGNIGAVQQIVAEHDGTITRDELRTELASGLWRFPPEARAVIARRLSR
ncbi:right-handed parallel beta-helix repeat-containing protein [candidate division KSB1 bacterium]|nr:right-handed parallel beta-helix repeat-containing protein [candidate division KSB1 bacterium]